MVLARHRTEKTEIEGRETASWMVFTHTYVLYTYVHIVELENKLKRNLGESGSPFQVACDVTEGTIIGRYRENKS